MLSGMCVFVILPYGLLDDLIEDNKFFQILLDISLVLYFFYIVSCIMLFFCGLFYPEDLACYFPLVGINSFSYCIMENVFCYVLFIHGYIILWFYGSLCSKVFLILFILLILLDILVYWIVYKLHSRSKKTLVLGSIIGMVWGLFSLFLFFILLIFTVFNSWIIDSSVYSGVIVNIIILMCYTWFLSLSSFLLYKNNKPDTTLPITH